MDTTVSNIILDDQNQRYCEIYKIVNLISKKIYIGQAVSHILNHNRYRPYGRQGRFKCHVSEAYSNKKNQSHYLNNAIRKYGSDNFEVELIEYCDIQNADDREKHYIETYNSLYPNGYNLKNGGRNFAHSDESKKRLSIGVMKYFEERKFARFINIKNIDDDVEKYIKPLVRNNTQYGWYVYINRIKADFGGVHIKLDDSKQHAIHFILELKRRISNTTKLQEHP
jgi:group I intron endonuclease